MFLLLEKVNRHVRRTYAGYLFRRPQPIRLGRPIISFTFDDFPRSALLTGGEILRRSGLSGTYYTALGLLGKDSPSGPVFVGEDLTKALRDGHELGCHTFAHCDSWQTQPRAFEESVLQNRLALSELIPSYHFKSFSYPISMPRPMSKRAVSKYFSSSRGGGQRFNSGVADLNQLSAYFLEKAGGEVELVKALIDKNKEARGWLIFATHDISAAPSPFGCIPEFFEEVVRHAVDSGAQILPVVSALNVVLDEASSNQLGMGKRHSVS
ncbi:MAG TPA: polysaccharide deacetylase family protein [Terracidiphilus sp.]|jgi:peptidoglycan/xylan/chitin deacetylase (PgdA/CDA1 family)